MAQDRILTMGSLWHRWDPHIHTPETILNDQFKGENAWESYFDILERSNPQIEAIGVTDYYLLENYEKVVSAKKRGRLSSIALIFPNIEMRLELATRRPINLHLLISPEDPDHVEQSRRFLEGLSFNVQVGKSFRCARNDLISLGKHHDPNVKSKEAAIEIGVNQFKVEIDQFIEQWRASDWIQNNALIAVASSSKDGTASLHQESSFAATRQKVERLAHIIFSPRENDRNFWLGNGRIHHDSLIEKYGSLKLCLHGSDAHQLDDVGVIQKERYSWIKGGLTFETLRQACMEPEHRATIGLNPPEGPANSRIIRSVSVKNSRWFVPEKVPLNPGLVGIIGPRGSGKTALVDMLAAAGGALSSNLTERSFVYRAKDFLQGEIAKLTWADGETTENEFSHLEENDPLVQPDVQYLSQQFVEILCSADGVTDELVAEIERVIYASHSPEDRHGTTNFRELMDAKAALGRQLRSNSEQSIRQISDDLARERDKQDTLDQLKERRKKLTATVARDERARVELVKRCSGDSKIDSQRFKDVSNAIQNISPLISLEKRRLNSLRLLKSYVEQYRETIAFNNLRTLSSQYAEAGLSENEWQEFRTNFVGNVDQLIDNKLTATNRELKRLIGPNLALPTDAEVSEKETILPVGKPLDKIPLNLLVAESKRLESLIEIEQGNRARFGTLTKNISKNQAELMEIGSQIKDINQAPQRIDTLTEARMEDYANVFKGILAEEAALHKLYSPLSAQLKEQGGALRKLSVSIKRRVDIEEWAQQGEDLLDLRRAGGFRGQGSLLYAAKTELQGVWESGTAEDVAKAMSKFRRDHDEKFRKSSPYDKRTDLSGFRQWARKLTEWFYSTDHIRVTYSLRFDGIEIERLSPGTRGIVLMLLYLAIDNEDERPLIIDQPEENLDPKSIHDELVNRFRESRLRRQIVIVTHNANLIVNTDVDQVIVATCGPHEPHELPKIVYRSGGLEDPKIRRDVCEILEGGEIAFKERAKRLRVRLSDR